MWNHGTAETSFLSGAQRAIGNRVVRDMTEIGRSPAPLRDDLLRCWTNDCSGKQYDLAFCGNRGLQSLHDLTVYFTPGDVLCLPFRPPEPGVIIKGENRGLARGAGSISEKRRLGVAIDLDGPAVSLFDQKAACRGAASTRGGVVS